MVGFVNFLLLFLLVRCSASQYIIELTQERYHVKARNSPSLELNQLLTMNVYSDEDVEKIRCNSKNYKTTYFEANMYKHNDRNYYTPLNINIIATPALNTTWACVLVYKKLDVHLENFIYFSLKVDIRESYGSSGFNSDTTWYISGAVATIIIVIIVAVTIVRVRRKTRARQTDPDATVRNDDAVRDPVYESVNYVPCRQQDSSPKVVIASKQPSPQPQGEVTEAKKYIHYDTVYEGRLQHMMMMDLLRKQARK